MTPLISVVMPVRNGGRWLGEAIESIVRQTLADLELLAVDDGSTDQTPQILADWSRRDGRVCVLRQSSLGLVAALNRGLAAARGPLLARLDGDDRAVPQRLERQARFMADNPRIGLLGSWAQRIDQHGRRRGELRPQTRPDALAAVLTRSNPFIHSTVMLRTDIARGLGGYRAAFEAAEDYDFWLRMSEVTLVANLAESLVQYRRHSGNVTARLALRQAFSVRLAQRSATVRRRTGCDPAADLPAAPDWRLPQALSSFYAEEAVTYRLLDFADPDYAARNADADFSPLLARLPDLSHAERQLAARAMVNRLRYGSAAELPRNLHLLACIIWQRPGMGLPAARSLLGRIRQHDRREPPPIVVSKDASDA